MEKSHVSRPEAIERIRGMLKSLTHDDECACSTAARFGVFCQGLTKLSDPELKARYDWIARTRPKASRAELEELVRLYHVSRQAATGTGLCCDLETRERCGCDGWNQFDDRALERFYKEMIGEDVQVG